MKEGIINLATYDEGEIPVYLYFFSDCFLIARPRKKSIGLKLSMKSFKFTLAEMLYLDDISLKRVEEGDNATFAIHVKRISDVPIKKRLFEEGKTYKFYSDSGEDKEAWTNVVKENIEQEKRFRNLSTRVLQYSSRRN